MYDIGVVGTGYVGLVTGVGLSDKGNRVTCIDTDERKINKLRRGIMPIYEKGLEQMVRENVDRGNLSFSTDLTQSLDNHDLIFVAVGTPPNDDDSADLSQVIGVARQIGQHANGPVRIINKSTVPTGTGDIVEAAVREELAKRDVEYFVDVISNPEFLREGRAIQDFMYPDRIVVGTNDSTSRQMMYDLYRPFTKKDSHRNILIMDRRSAEAAKYAANGFLSNKINYINLIAQFCESVGANVESVAESMRWDPRIGRLFLYPGHGSGGSCFPKDDRSLAYQLESAGIDAGMIRAGQKVNAEMKAFAERTAVKLFGDDLSGRVFGLWGLAFKPGTDDVREAPALEIVRGLTRRGALVRAYDPKARETAQEALGPIDGFTTHGSKYVTLDGADAVILATEWNEFQTPDFHEMTSLMKSPVTVIDGRNQYFGHFPEMKKAGIRYFPVGVGEEALKDLYEKA